jgi:hypothetical protein
MFSMIVVMAATAAACGGGGGDSGGDDIDGTPATTAGATTAPVATTAPGPTVPATGLTLRVTEVRLVNSEESDSGMRMLLPAGVANAAVTLTGLPTPNQVISVCQARELDSRMTGAFCRTPANGETVTVPLGAAATGVELVQVGTAGPGPEGNSARLDEVNIRYTASSRELNVRLPQIAAENGGRPTFRLTPASTDGAYRASLSWTSIPVFGGNITSGRLELLQGGAVANQAQGGADTRLTGVVPPPIGDVAIRVSNTGGGALVSPKVTLLLP